MLFIFKEFLFFCENNVLNYLEYYIYMYLFIIGGLFFVIYFLLNFFFCDNRVIIFVYKWFDFEGRVINLMIVFF